MLAKLYILCAVACVTGSLLNKVYPGYYSPEQLAGAYQGEKQYDDTFDYSKRSKGDNVG